VRATLIATTVGAILSATALVAAPGAAPGASADDGSLSVGGAGSDSARSSHPLAAATVPRAATPVVVGATGTPAGCPGNSTWTQQASAAGSPSYIVPGAGVITSYSHNANANAGSIRFVILGPAPAPNDRVVLAFTALQPVTVSTLNTFAVRMPVPAGASIGTFINTTQMGCAFVGIAGDELSGATLDPSTSNAYVPAGSFPNLRLNLSAVWEPDVDNDQFGDISQDLCPESALTQAACPAPDTTVTKAPKKKSTKRKAKIKFTSVAGATFTCAVDGKAAKPSTSPFKQKFKYGKHVVLITATSPFGIVEATPAKVKFKIKRPA
jgi:hypothetical protein